MNHKKHVCLDQRVKKAGIERCVFPQDECSSNSVIDAAKFASITIQEANMNRQRHDGVSLILRNGALAEFVSASHSSATRNARLVSVVHRSSSSLAFDALSIRRISLWLRGQRRCALCNRSTTLQRRLAAVCTTTCCCSSYHLPFTDSSRRKKRGHELTFVHCGKPLPKQMNC